MLCALCYFATNRRHLVVAVGELLADLAGGRSVQQPDVAEGLERQPCDDVCSAPARKQTRLQHVFVVEVLHGPDKSAVTGRGHSEQG